MTNQKILEMKAGETLWDNEGKGCVPKLHIRCLESGRRSFMLYYRTRSGQQRRPKLGDFGSITIAQAREYAREILKDVITGKDPKAQWDIFRAEKTIQELYDQVYAEYWGKDPRFELSKHRENVRSCWKVHLKPTFGPLKVSEVTRSRIRAWKLEREDTPYAANRSLENLSKLFNYAIDNDLVPEGTANPCLGIPAFKEKKRTRYATEAELKRIVAILNEQTSAYPRETTFLKLLILTGSRPRALERARKDQLLATQVAGETYGVLRFEGKSSSESGESETVVIPPTGMQLLSLLPSSKSPLLIGCKMPRDLWDKVKEQVGCDDLWARDMRRTFATVGMSGGVDKDVIGKLLNHSASETTDIYAKLNPTARIKAVSAIAGMMEDIVTDKVVPPLKAEA